MVFEQNLTDDQLKIIEARHHDPFAVLGRHPTKSGVYVRAFLPHTESATVGNNLPMKRVEGTDIFEWTGRSDDLETPYQIHRTTSQNQIQSHYDPYCFTPQISDYDLYLFAEGKHWHAYRILGSHKRTVNGVEGVMFATWAPNAQRVSVVGTFNRWDGRSHPMRSRGSTGVWELFIPGLEIGELYKYEIRNYHDCLLYTSPSPRDS